MAGIRILDVEPIKSEYITADSKMPVSETSHPETIDLAITITVGLIADYIDSHSKLADAVFPATLSISYSPAGNGELGKAESTKFSWSMSKKTDGGSAQLTIKESKVDGVSVGNKTSETKNTDDTVSITVEATSEEGTTKTEKRTRYFYAPIYSGLVNSSFKFTQENIEGLEGVKKYLQGGLNISRNLGTLNNNVAFLAYPNPITITKVLDGNGFDISERYKTDSGWNTEIVEFTLGTYTKLYTVLKSSVFSTEGDVTHIYK